MSRMRCAKSNGRQGMVYLVVIVTSLSLCPAALCENPQEKSTGFGDGLGPVQIDGKWGFIDEQGRLVIEPRFDQADSFSDGLAGVAVGNLWGYIDKHGRYIVQPKYSYVPPFREGLAALPAGDKFGYIDVSGKFVIPAQFDMACCFSEKVARVTLNGKPAYIDHTGKIVLRPAVFNPKSFSDGLAAFLEEDKKTFGFIDHQGRVVIPAKHRRTGHATTPYFQCGRARIYLGWCSEYIDKSGKVVIPPLYVEASDFSEGLAAVREERRGRSDSPKIGFIDTDGKYAIQPRFDAAGIFCDGLAGVSINGREGYIDHSGRFVIDLPGGRGGNNFCGGFAWVEGPRPDWFGYIDKRGKYIWGPREYRNTK